MNDLNEINVNEIIKVQTLPDVFYKLEKVGEYIDKELKKLEEFNCDEASKKEIKNIKKGIDDVLKNFESRRIEIKKQILEPYEIFNKKYEEEVKTKLENASAKFSEKIKEIELEQRNNINANLKMFADEYIISENLENIVSYEDIPIKVNISSSEKKLKEEIVNFLEKVSSDINLISLESNYQDEIMYEYKKNGFDFVKAKTLVVSREKEKEEQQRVIEERKNKIQQDNSVVEKVVENEELLSSPREIIENEENKIYNISFTIKATKEQIIKLKSFMESEGIIYD